MAAEPRSPFAAVALREAEPRSPFAAVALREAEPRSPFAAVALREAEEPPALELGHELMPPPGGIGQVAYESPEAGAVRQAIAAGISDVNELTNRGFFARHPERGGRPLSPSEPGFGALSTEWKTIRDTVVRPMLDTVARSAPGAPAMSGLWVPGAERLSTSRSGGTYLAGPWRFVFHTIEGEPSANAFRQLAAGHANPSHLWAMPSANLLLQTIPLDRSAYALARPGSTQTNRLQAVQVELWGYAANMAGASQATLVWLADRVLAPVARMVPINLDNVRPVGGEYCYGTSSSCRMSADEWNRFDGVCGHKDVPDNSHWDPGGLNMAAIAARAKAQIGGSYIRRESAVAGHDGPGFLAEWDVEPQWLEHGGIAPLPGSSEIELLDEVDRKSRGYAVWAQQSLNRLANAGLTADGAIGPLSRAAIKRFQAAHGLTADGIVGAKTEAALIAAGAAPPPGSTTEPTPVGSKGGAVQTPTTVTGAAIPIPVPAQCVDVPPLAGPDQGCAGVDSMKFAGIAEVATFAAGLADCYSNRMAARRQRERHAKAQEEAARLAKSVRIPNETPTVRAQRIAAARAAVQPEPVESVRTLIRTQYLELLEEEFRDTIIGANNRYGQKCRLRSVARMWMFGKREQLDFLTLGTMGRSLQAFAPPPKPAAGDQLVDIEPPATTDDGAKVQPIMNTFLRELRSRAPLHDAYNYPVHGGGSFAGRGYSVDLELSPSPKDERGFYQRPAAVQFLLTVDDAARAAGVQWRAIYNDYAVAAAVNRHLDRRRVVFVGQPSRGRRGIGLNWHGPLILHFHLDITPQSQSPDREEEDLGFSALQEAEESPQVGMDGWTGEDLAAEDPEAYESSGAVSAETLTDLEEPASHLHTDGEHDLEDEWVGAAEELDADEALVLASADEEQTFGPDELDTALFADEQAGAAAEGPGTGTLEMLLGPRTTDTSDDFAPEHEFGGDDARTPVPVDVAAAVPPFEPAERTTIVEPLLSARASAKAVAWSNKVHPATSGVTLNEIRGALGSYVDPTTVQAAIDRQNKRNPDDPIDASSTTTYAVLVECVHQFQKKCYRDKREHDGQAGESTLDSLGLIARVGSEFRRADRGHANAQQRLHDRDKEIKSVTANEFSAANWFNRMADPSVFGMRTKLGHGLHVVLVRKLRQAERHLLTLPRFRGKTPAALGHALGLSEKHGGARPTQTGSTSVHTFGLAIDIAYLANPWVRRAASWHALQRAASLVSGTSLRQASAPEYFSSLRLDPARSTGQIWDEVQQRNAELITYIGLEGDALALRAALQSGQARGTAGLVNSGESLADAVARWRTQIGRDRQALAGGDFAGHEPPGKGFLTHARDLVIALRDHGCLAWGAVDLGPGALGSGDIMHFDARIDGAGRALTKGGKAHLPTVGHPCLPGASPPRAESESEPGSDAESAADKAKDTIRAQTTQWGTDEAAIMAALRALLPSEMAELSADPTIVDMLGDELSGAELAAAGAQLARGRVGSMARVDIDRILAAPDRYRLGTLAAAMARDILLGHHEAFDRRGTGTIHGNKCSTVKPAGATASDCTVYVLDVLKRAFTAKGQAAVWTDVLREALRSSGQGGLKGTEVIKALQGKQGWEALFWAPDPRNPGDGLSLHSAAYRNMVLATGKYYGITVDKDKLVIEYRRTNPASRTDLSGIERLRRLQFGVLAARGGTHMALVVNGSVYEVHEVSPATDRDAIEATPLEHFSWQSGTIAAPPGDLALAWRTR
jgi:peptidoglycan hydrolase-like protein with peptidoglycan-binding domain